MKEQRHGITGQVSWRSTSAQYQAEEHKYWGLNFWGPPTAPPGTAGAAPGCLKGLLSAHATKKMQTWLQPGLALSSIAQHS